MLQINYDPATNPLNNNEWSFPLFECIHIAMFAMSIGTIALVDLRMLGLALKKYSPAELLKSTSTWTLVGLVVVITSGFVIFTSDPFRYSVHPAMQYKFVAIAVGVIYNYTIHRKVAMSPNPSPALSAIVAIVSLALWISITFSGIFYSFI